MCMRNDDDDDDVVAYNHFKTYCLFAHLISYSVFYVYSMPHHINVCRPHIKGRTLWKNGMTCGETGGRRSKTFLQHFLLRYTHIHIHSLASSKYPYQEATIES